MKKCPYCKIEVGGDLIKCPLCQSKLMGEGEAAYFPRLENLQKRSLFYKFQLFFVWAILIIGLGLDFLLQLRLPGFPNLHWSLILAMWLVVFEFGIMRQFRPGTGSARKVTMMVIILLALLAITAYFFGFLMIVLDLVVPIVLTGTIIANFVLAMVDKNGNTMAYLLSGLLFGVIPSIILYFTKDEMPIAWIICMIMSVVLFVGAVIFKGRSVTAEIQRRFNV
ncbi:MAG: hypothetical protein IKP88_13585 [Lachnospiraceae bacterium]|nr:hypothetical protein [Lachnospiraceae bacterium]